jgi:REP element-mobilizing transposase RayT
MDAKLDKADYGPRWLEEEAVAGCVVQAIGRGETALRQYIVHAFVVMPNHVHLLIEPRIPLARIMNGLKGVSARDANRILARTGKHFWQDESFDHWVRDTAEFQRIRDYIIQNPVRAGLVGRPEEWPWSGTRFESTESEESHSQEWLCHKGLRR